MLVCYHSILEMTSIEPLLDQFTKRKLDLLSFHFRSISHCRGKYYTNPPASAKTLYSAGCIVATGSKLNPIILLCESIRSNS